jgi:peptide deformylase
MTKQLHISQLGDPVLRQISQPILQIDAGVQVLIEHLMSTLDDANGVGIAAPQVGQLRRLIIVASRPNPRYPDAPKMEPTVMINPCILNYTSSQEKGWEGCLSVPGVRGLVPRYQAIEVEYMTATGEVKRQWLQDFVARIFQHELDHLNGFVFLDRIESEQDLISEQEYLQQFSGNGRFC